MRHATVNAIHAIHAILGNLFFYSMETVPCAIVTDGCWFRACDWGEGSGSGSYEWFTASAGGRLRAGVKGRDVVLPDCHRCAVLVDLALELSRPVDAQVELWSGAQFLPLPGYEHRLSALHWNWLRTR